MLEAAEWSVSSLADDAYPNDHLSLFAESDDENGFDMEAVELEREMSGLRMAIEKGDDDSDDEESELKVEQLDSLILRMQALKGGFPNF